jgi:hypothetical protein
LTDPATTTQEWILTGAAVLSAVGTIAAVLTALFIVPWRARKRRPKLWVTFDPQDGFDTMTDIPTHGGGLSHWVLPRVHCEAGRDAAIDVEVVFIEMVNVTTGEPLLFENRCLEWSGVGGTRLTVAPGIHRHITLLFLMDPEHPVSTDGTEGFEAFVVVKPEPGANRNALGAGKYRARFAVTAANADAVEYEMDIDYDGTWWRGAAIWDHLAIGEPRPISTRKRSRQKK